MSLMRSPNRVRGSYTSLVWGTGQAPRLHIEFPSVRLWLLDEIAHRANKDNYRLYIGSIVRLSAVMSCIRDFDPED